MKERRNFSKNSNYNDTIIDDQFQIRYLDLFRLIEANDLKRFQFVAAKVDLNVLQEGNKPFIFHGIFKDELDLVKFLLDQEIDVQSEHLIDIVPPDEENPIGVYKTMTPLQYAKYLEKDEMAKLIQSKMNEASLEERWLKTIERNNINDIDFFKDKIKNPIKLKEMFEIGLIKAAEIGSMRLTDYFIGEHKVNVNCMVVVNGIKVTPLLNAIAHRKIELAKYLIFRKADINIIGEYGDALVTAVHYESPSNFITLLLEKGASLASRHQQWPSLNLREFCVQFNKVKAKATIDEFVFRLIANGDYEKLKSIADNGYITINVTNRFRKTGRDLAIERCHSNIVQLIDKIEERQRRLKTKMNY